jgi:hypothetical protein
MICSLLTRPLELDLPGGFVFPQPFKARMAPEVVSGPGGEGHLRHQAGLDPAGTALVGAGDRGEERIGVLKLA